MRSRLRVYGDITKHTSVFAGVCWAKECVFLLASVYAGVQL